MVPSCGSPQCGGAEQVGERPQSQSYRGFPPGELQGNVQHPGEQQVLQQERQSRQAAGAVA